MNGRRRLPTPLFALALTLTSCTTTGTGATTREAVARMCSAWPYVTWSVHDTHATIADAKANNAARTAFCETAG